MANFCSNCGASVSGVNFCANCGTAVNSAGAANNTNTGGTVPINTDFVNNTNTNSGSGFFNSNTAKTAATVAGVAVGASLLSNLLGGRRRNLFTGLPTGIMGMGMNRPPHGPCHNHGPMGKSPMWHSPMGHMNFGHGPGGRGPFGRGPGGGHGGPGGPGGFGGPGPR